MKAWHLVVYVIVIWAIVSCVNNGMDIAFNLGKLSGHVSCQPYGD